MDFDTRTSSAPAGTSDTAIADTPRSAGRDSLRGKSFAEQSLQLKPDRAVQRRTMMQDIALGQDPNEREKGILENDADAASAWVQAAAWAIGISTTYSHTRPHPDKSMYLGRADALRHTLWNAYMAFMLGEDRAKALADAHELPRPPSDANSRVDREMDLRNNAVGRMLGVTARDGNMLTRAFALTFIAAAAITFLNDGSLNVVDQSGDPWRLVPSNTEGID